MATPLIITIILAVMALLFALTGVTILIKGELFFGFVMAAGAFIFGSMAYQAYATPAGIHREMATLVKSEKSLYSQYHRFGNKVALQQYARHNHIKLPANYTVSLSNVQNEVVIGVGTALQDNLLSRTLPAPASH